MAETFSLKEGMPPTLTALREFPTEINNGACAVEPR